MMRVTFLITIFCFILFSATAQTTEELKRQRNELKKEIDENQKLLNIINADTKNNLSTYSAISSKAQLQERVLINVAKDINILDNNIYGIQKDVNKYDRLLDTLKQEYAKSMVYAYKNRGNYEFLNFIFSADNFNEAIKRIAYLKSYRAYREMQGQNILRTQNLRKNRLEDLGASKQTKSSTLEIQTVEMKKLAEQKEKQANIVAQLKKQGQDLNARIAARQKQMAKINLAVKAAIAKALREENERRIIAEKEAKRKRAEAQAEADRLARIKKAADDKLAKQNALKTNTKDPVKTSEPVKNVTAKVAKEPKIAEPVILASENVSLNNSLERNRGILPWPVDNPAILNHYGPNRFESGAVFINDAVTIAAPLGATVKSVFQGTVIMVSSAEEGKYFVMIKNGSYFFTYVNLTNVAVKINDEVKTGQMLGRVAANLDGVGAIDFKTAKGNTDLDPEKWLRKR
jgi:murein hydrolase activator